MLIPSSAALVGGRAQVKEMLATEGLIMAEALNDGVKEPKAPSERSEADVSKIDANPHLATPFTDKPRRMP